MKYFVHIYRTMRFKVAVEAPDNAAAIQKADELLPVAIKRSEWDCFGDISYERDKAMTDDHLPFFCHAEDAEETTGYLVDEVEDQEYERSRSFFADGTHDDGMLEPIMVSPEEFDTILAALRFWQRCGNEGHELEMDIALNGRETALSDEAIDDLCERINT